MGYALYKYQNPTKDARAASRRTQTAQREVGTLSVEIIMLLAQRNPKGMCLPTVGHGQVKSWTVLTDDLYCDLARVDGIQPSAQSDAYNDTSQCPEYQHLFTEGEVLELAPAAYGRWGFAQCHLLFGAHVCCRLDVHDGDMTRSSKGHSQARPLLAPSLCEPEIITWVRLRGCT